MCVHGRSKSFFFECGHCYGVEWQLEDVVQKQELLSVQAGYHDGKPLDPLDPLDRLGSVSVLRV